MKVAISLPDPVFEAAERLAKQRKLSRSELYVAALSEYLDAHSADAVTAKLDEIYATESSVLDPALARAQSKAIGREAW
jgi:metal-responsive CopG/Arc/MetJ family transcriptional regulator